MNNSMSALQETQDNKKYADFAKRLKGFAFDYLIIISYVVFLAGATLAVSKIAGILGLSLRWPENPIIADLIAFLTLILPVLLYFTLQESSPKQATWGKRKAGIRVVNANGGMLTRRQAFARSLIKLLPWQIAHTCIFQIGGFTSTSGELSPLVITGFALVYLLVGIYIASILLTKKHQTPYDWISGSYIIIAH